MRKNILLSVLLLPAVGTGLPAQYRQAPPAEVRSSLPVLSQPTDSAAVILTLDDALRVALSENASLKVAGKEIQRTGYALKGTYAALFPQIDASGSYQRTLIRNDIRAMMGDGGMAEMMKDTKIGNLNTFSAGVSASMPLVNAQLWENIKISADQVELAVEKARGSRIETIAQVKDAFYGVLLAKQLQAVYRQAWENAGENFEVTRTRHAAGKASELQLSTARTQYASTVPDLYQSMNNTLLALWQLKAVMGVGLEENIDVAGTLEDYAAELSSGLYAQDDLSLSNNSQLKQLALQAENLISAVKVQSYAYLPTLSLAASLTYSAVANDPIENMGWFPYSYASLSLRIPIFSGLSRLNQVRAAQNQYEQFQIQRDNTERQLKIAVVNYLGTMDAQAHSYQAAREALSSAEKAYRIAQKSYDVGRATLVELSDALLALTRNQLAVSQSIYSWLSAKTELESTLGKE